MRWPNASHALSCSQVEQSLNYFAENFAHVQQDAETHSGSEIDWEHERIERFLRTFRNLRTSLTPLYEVRVHTMIRSLFNAQLH
jgi:hypothetical protein